MDYANMVPEKGRLTIKKEEKGYVVFNMDTSGFHMLSEDAIKLLDACDGSKTIRDLAKQFSQSENESVDSLEKEFSEFFRLLEERRIIKWKA